MIRFLFHISLRAMGWRIIGSFPHHIPKAVCIVAPHTSNWDFFIGIAARSEFGILAHYLAKRELFDSPFGWFFRITHGIPVDRKNKHHLTEEIIQRSTAKDTFYIAITPEGTRKNVCRWKSGFYNIAMNAQMPIIPFGLDYQTKSVIIGDAFYPTGNYSEDLIHFGDFFKSCIPKNSDNWCADFE